MMIRRTLTAALGAVVLLTSAMLPALPAEASETQVTVGSRQVEVTFNNPISAGGADWAHHDKLRRLIADAPAGAEIRLGIYYLTRDNIVDSLRDAVARGVSVYVVADGTSSHRTAQLRALATLLDSRMRICGTGTSGGCLSNASGGFMHAKYMLISQTKDNQGTSRSNVVWVSSANLTTPSGAEQFNNSVTIYDDESLYDGYMSQVWNPMWAGTRNYPGNDYYVASMPRGYFGSSASNSTVFVSPEQNTDLVANRLANISPDSNCRIRVMQASFSDSRSAVADKLVSLKAGGCKVWIVVGEVVKDNKDDKDDKGDDPMGENNLKKFKRAGISVHRAKVHDKVILVSERANNAHTWVLVGSQNLTEHALRDEDNILMRLQDSKALYDAYYAHFNDAYNR